MPVTAADRDPQHIQPCPECGADIRVGRRFTTWCSACDWNVDPARPEEKLGRTERARRAPARRYGGNLPAEMTAGGEMPRARRDASSLLAYAVASAVHAVTLVLALGGIWFVVTGWSGLGMAPGLLLLARAWSLPPRLPEPPEDAPLLRRATAPEAFARVDEITQATGTRSVDATAVDGEINASVRCTACAGTGC